MRIFVNLDGYLLGELFLKGFHASCEEYILDKL